MKIPDTYPLKPRQGMTVSERRAELDTARFVDVRGLVHHIYMKPDGTPLMDYQQTLDNRAGAKQAVIDFELANGLLEDDSAQPTLITQEVPAMLVPAVATVQMAAQAAQSPEAPVAVDAPVPPTGTKRPGRGLAAAAGVAPPPAPPPAPSQAAPQFAPASTSGFVPGFVPPQMAQPQGSTAPVAPYPPMPSRPMPAAAAPAPAALDLTPILEKLETLENQQTATQEILDSLVDSLEELNQAVAMIYLWTEGLGQTLPAENRSLTGFKNLMRQYIDSQNP